MPKRFPEVVEPDALRVSLEMDARNMEWILREPHTKQKSYEGFSVKGKLAKP